MSSGMQKSGKFIFSDAPAKFQSAQALPATAILKDHAR
jgi:hypothetical protein